MLNMVNIKRSENLFLSIIIISMVTLAFGIGVPQYSPNRAVIL